MCQSSNDVIPAAIHVSAALAIKGNLVPALDHLARTLRKRAAENDDVVKTGRTHLMDAMPVRLSQEIGGWAAQIEQSIERVNASLPRLQELAIGGTAVGTGINAHPEFGRRMAKRLAEMTQIPFTEARTTLFSMLPDFRVAPSSRIPSAVAPVISRRRMTTEVGSVRWIAGPVASWAFTSSMTMARSGPPG